MGNFLATLGCGGVGVAAGPFLIDTTNLYAYWKLDSIAATTPDGFGGRDFTVAAGSAIAGKIGGAYDVEAVPGSLTSNDIGFAFLDIDFTIRFWFWHSTSNNVIILNRKSNAGPPFNGYRCQTDTVNGPSFYVEGTNAAQVNWTGPLSINEWHHCVYVHDAVNDLLKVSVDGGAFVTTPFAAGPGDALLQLGVFTSGTGRIDEIGIWKRAWSAGDVTFDYRGGGGRTL